MSPPPAPIPAVPRRSEGEETHESRHPREGTADLLEPEDLVTQAGWDVEPPNACEGIPRDPKRRRRPRRGNALKG
jgi:hypothetical protein